MLPENTKREPGVTFTCRTEPEVRRWIHDVAKVKGYPPSTTGAMMLKTLKEIQDALLPYAPTIERMMRQERLTYAEAVARLVWAKPVDDVQLLDE